jgi:hypothetical protein
MASKAEAASPLTGENFGKLPRYPCATVSFWSNQDSELSYHGNDVILSADEKLFIQRGIYEIEVEEALSL